MREGSITQLAALAVEFVRQAFDEQHAENEFLELARVHLAAQDVGGLEQETFQLREGDFILVHVLFILYVHGNGVFFGWGDPSHSQSASMSSRPLS